MPGDALEPRMGLIEHRQVLGFVALSTSLAFMDHVLSLGLSSEHPETVCSHGLSPATELGADAQAFPEF